MLLSANNHDPHGSATTNDDQFNRPYILGRLCSIKTRQTWLTILNCCAVLQESEIQQHIERPQHGLRDRKNPFEYFEDEPLRVGYQQREPHIACHVTGFDRTLFYAIGTSCKQRKQLYHSHPCAESSKIFLTQ
ncbi:uncharacterized protein LOC135157596 [Lytechinus pictus]|uniref:uncharacterized protein LOC135157596 n=1 Tax=Lytechinus pictus TaxID=7653 RepID=UPI0030BA19B1